MYTPIKVSIHEYRSFAPPAPPAVAHETTVDVTGYGYPTEAVAVELLVGCRSWVDGAYVAAYDGVEFSVGNIALYPSASMRNQWMFSRGRVELANSRFLLRIRPVGEPIEVIVILKGYYT
jgi:hypothetical protein